MGHRIKPFTEQINSAIDQNDPAAAKTAIEIRFPESFSDRAWKVIRYFDGAMYLYVYKGKFVVTDESLELTEYGDGTTEAPFGAPRWTGDSLEELEDWLLMIADEYDRNGDVPGWEVDKSPEPEAAEKPAWHEPSPNIMVTMTQTDCFIGFKTYCRKDGSHGRFLVFQSSLYSLLEAGVGKSRYEKDGDDYVQITRMEDSLHFSFAWLTVYGNGNVKGVRQDFAIPLSKIRLVLDWSETVRHLYVPAAPQAVIDARPAAGMIREIVKDKRLRRALTKAMRDCFRWPGEQITLYPDGRYSFYFVTKSGCPKNGGLILHKGMKDGHEYVYYSVHT